MDPVKPLNRPPRVWPVFLTAVVALVSALAVQTVMVVAWLGWQVAQGADIRSVAERSVDELATPAAMIFLGIPTQLAIGLCAIVAARFSRQPPGSRLGLQRPLLPVWGYPVIAIGALFPLAIGVTLASLIANFIPPDPSIERLYGRMTNQLAIPFILFISLAPGLMEELLFRGYIQTRLLQRWRPWVAILVTSTIFGIFHITPHSIANAFIIGLWFGVLAWKTGSVWPSILCHAFINGAWNIWHIGVMLWGFPETPPTILTVCACVVVIACFIVSIQIIWTRRGPTSDAQLAQ